MATSPYDKIRSAPVGEAVKTALTLASTGKDSIAILELD